MGFLKQEYWSGLPFPFPVIHIPSENAEENEDSDSKLLISKNVMFYKKLVPSTVAFNYGY